MYCNVYHISRSKKKHHCFIYINFTLLCLRNVFPTRKFIKMKNRHKNILPLCIFTYST